MNKGSIDTFTQGCCFLCGLTSVVTHTILCHGAQKELPWGGPTSEKKTKKNRTSSYSLMTLDLEIAGIAIYTAKLQKTPCLY